MDNKGLTRLSKLRELNANPEWQNVDLYRLMFQSDLYILAYERIKSSPGNMTAGVDGSTIDGFSMTTIENIIRSMRDQSFVFTRARRKYIPKANGKLRPLGIPSPKDKVVQEVIRLILESIYDGDTPSFKDTSHGFRSGRGTHSCLKVIRGWHSVSWFIEGDIKSCFDLIDHGKLMEILRKRIKDERFIDLIWKALRAGYMEGYTPMDSLSGTPQGSIVSPILANIFLHELDCFVESLIAKHDKGERKRANPAYTAIVKERRRIKSGRKLATPETLRQLEQQMRKIPSLMHDDPNFVRVKYARYADDWIIGLDGSKALAEELKKEIKDFLADTLKLTLSDEKTHIRNARNEEAFFLGTTLRIGVKGAEPKHTRVKTATGKEFVKRTTGHTTRMEAPIQKLIGRLAERGFCSKDGTPLCKRGWIYLDLDQIVKQYNSVLEGVRNYYSFADNYIVLKHIQHILQQSALHTFCRKLQVRKPTVYKRFGPNLAIPVRDKEGKVVKTVSLKLSNDWKPNRMRFQEGETMDKAHTHFTLRTRSKLEEDCCICGETEGIEMHHLRHVRKGKSTGFARVMSSLNRKQVPVCGKCHQRIHDGVYDSIKLANFARPDVAAR